MWYNIKEMVFIVKENHPAKGLGKKILVILMLLVAIVCPPTLFLGMNTLRYNNYNLLNNTVTIVAEEQYDNIFDITSISKEKVQECSNAGEISEWKFNKDKFLNSKIVVGVTKDPSNDLKEKIKSCIELTYNQYELKIDDNTTFYFKSEKEAKDYKGKIKNNSEIKKITVGKVNVTSQADLDKKYAEITKPIVVARNVPKVTSRGGNSRNVSGNTGILPLESYVYISSGYKTKSRPTHSGIDYAANYGTKIKAFKAGIVIRASWYGGYGNCIEIKHENGLVTRYGHCSGFNVKVGQHVSQGQVIGFVGSTGNSTGNHLHFETIINGVHYNPLNYIK